MFWDEDIVMLETTETDYPSEAPWVCVFLVVVMVMEGGEKKDFFGIYVHRAILRSQFFSIHNSNHKLK